MQITCHGAAGFVTGSCHLVETDTSRFLIDCGMYQGSKSLNRLNYEPFPFNPETIDFVIVTHGHIDHCGLLPKLIKFGFKGSIYASPATADLLPIMLADSAHIQEMDTEHENRRRLRKGETPREPLYTMEHAEHVTGLLQVVEYDQTREPANDVTFRLRDAGHVIGSSLIELYVRQKDDSETKIVFSGDLGQWDVPIIEDPTYIWNADYVFVESTYGDREHVKDRPRKDELFEHIQNTYRKGGKLLIPCFALERTQELLYTLSELKQRKDFPPMDIYLDSPLAIKITEVFKNHPDIYDEEARARTDEPFDFPGLICTPSVDESRRVNNMQEPAIVIAGSGMCTAGRIRHHLKHGIWNPRNTVLFVGYQAPGTLGRFLLEGAEEIKMMGMNLAVKADIARIGSFSAHADRRELTRWLTMFREKPETVFLIHGEQRTLEAFGSELRNKGFSIKIPVKGEPVFA